MIDQKMIKQNLLLVSMVFLGITNVSAQEVVDLPIAPRKVAAILQPVQTKTVQEAQGTTKVSTVMVQAMAQPVVAAESSPPPVPAFVISAGDRLSTALENWLSTQDIRISWEATGALPGRVRDVSIESTWQSSGDTVEEILQEILQPFGLQAMLLKTKNAPEKISTVVVKNNTTTRP